MGGTYNQNPTLGVSYVFVPKTADGLNTLLNEVRLCMGSIVMG